MEDYLNKVSTAVQNASLPSISNISVANYDSSSETLLNVVWKQTNYEISKARQFVTSYTFDSNKGLKTIPMFPTQTNSAILEKVSPSKKLKAFVHKIENATTKKEEFILEIGSYNSILQTINLSSFDKHGSIYSDQYFSGIDWSADESKLVYVAEKKRSKNSGFFDRKPLQNESESESEEDKVKDSKTSCGEKYNYEESWGEMLNDITNPILIIFNLKTETMEVVDDIFDNICPSQPQWIDQDTVLFTGYHTEPFRLGLRCCECRLSNVYTLSLKEVGKKITKICPNESEVSDHSARISNSKEKIVFIRRILNPEGNSHRGNELLILYSILDGTSKVIFGEKALMFSHDLPKNCWLSDDVHVVISNDMNGLKYAMIIDIMKGEIKEKIQCNALFNVESDLIFMMNQELDSAGATLKLGHFKEGKTTVYSEPIQKDEAMEYGKMVNEHGVVSFFLVPKNLDKPCPLVVIPHGGPHVMCSNNFNQSTSVFAKLGYAVLLCNYCGSTGFTKSTLNSLIGSIGNLDIKDVHNCVQMFISDHGSLINRKQIYIYGGSHGGFIGAHLVGQYPEFYCAAALLNPVIDIASMMMVTDIPDWTFLECGIPYSQGTIPSKEIYTEMIRRSPIIHLKNIKAPIILCIGGKDLRVPPSQGKSFYRLLQANGKIAKLLFYPEDSHPLMNIETNGDFFVNVCKWFYEHKRN